MRSKKITIVDIAEDDETAINNDVETVKEPLIEPLQSTEIVCVSTDIKKEPLIEPPVVNELKQIVKTTDLTECPKCHKMITNRTLKYSHNKTCGIIKQPIEQIPSNQPLDTDIKPVSVIKQLNTVDKLRNQPYKEMLNTTLPVQPTTFEEMRHNYYIDARKQHDQRMKALFAKAI